MVKTLAQGLTLTILQAQSIRSRLEASEAGSIVCTNAAEIVQIKNYNSASHRLNCLEQKNLFQTGLIIATIATIVQVKKIQITP